MMGCDEGGRGRRPPPGVTGDWAGRRMSGGQTEASRMEKERGIVQAGGFFI